jgi:hypothetical protein
VDGAARLVRRIGVELPRSPHYSAWQTRTLAAIAEKGLARRELEKVSGDAMARALRLAIAVVRRLLTG